MSKPVVVVSGASGFILVLVLFEGATNSELTIFRGIGLAVTRSLLEEHSARVVTLLRTRTPELNQLVQEHHQAL